MLVLKTNSKERNLNQLSSVGKKFLFDFTSRYNEKFSTSIFRLQIKTYASEIAEDTR